MDCLAQQPLSPYVVIPQQCAQLFANQRSTVDYFHIFNDTTSTYGGRFVTDTINRYYFPVDSCLSAYSWSYNVVYLPVDSFPQPVLTPTVH